ncbi:unnamed protein product, partial [Durusdinium trenchii]
MLGASESSVAPPCARLPALARPHARARDLVAPITRSRLSAVRAPRSRKPRLSQPSHSRQTTQREMAGWFAWRPLGAMLTAAAKGAIREIVAVLATRRSVVAQQAFTVSASWRLLDLSGDLGLGGVALLHAAHALGKRELSSSIPPAGEDLSAKIAAAEQEVVASKLAVAAAAKALEEAQSEVKEAKETLGDKDLAAKVEVMWEEGDSAGLREARKSSSREGAIARLQVALRREAIAQTNKEAADKALSDLREERRIMSKASPQ